MVNGDPIAMDGFKDQIDGILDVFEGGQAAGTKYYPTGISVAQGTMIRRYRPVSLSGSAANMPKYLISMLMLMSTSTLLCSERKFNSDDVIL